MPCPEGRVLGWVLRFPEPALSVLMQHDAAYLEQQVRLQLEIARQLRKVRVETRLKV